MAVLTPSDDARGRNRCAKAALYWPGSPGVLFRYKGSQVVAIPWDTSTLIVLA